MLISWSDTVYCALKGINLLYLKVEICFKILKSVVYCIIYCIFQSFSTNNVLMYCTLTCEHIHLAIVLLSMDVLQYLTTEYANVTSE
jgi:uncharacterized membrane protein YagU involved in acid resistance